MRPSLLIIRTVNVSGASAILSSDIVIPKQLSSFPTEKFTSLEKALKSEPVHAGKRAVTH